jgi:hypothetical protein
VDDSLRNNSDLKIRVRELGNFATYLAKQSLFIHLSGKSTTKYERTEELEQSFVLRRPNNHGHPVELSVEQ